MKKVLLAIAVLTFSMTLAQELVTSFPLHLKKNASIFYTLNKAENKINLFNINENYLQELVLDSQMKVIDSIIVPVVDKKYKSLIGNISLENKNILFWASSNKEKICSQTIYHNNPSAKIKTFDLDFKNELVLGEFSSADRFSILSIIKKSNALKLYVFYTDGRLEVQDIDTSALRFYHRENLYATLEEGFLPFEQPFSLFKIDTQSPVSLTQSAHKRKYYHNDKQIIISIDTDNNYTQVIFIDVDKNKASDKFFKTTPYKYFNTIDTRSNSFIIDDKLVQFKTSSDKASLIIKDFNDNIIKEYEIADGKEIGFKNSDIIQQNGRYSNKRILEKTSQFTRKTYNLNPGISLYKLDNNYLVTLGGISQDKSSNNASYAAMMFGVVGVLMYYAIATPTQENFNSYINRKVVYFNSILSADGGHVDGEIKPIAFDKIQIFLEDKKEVKNPNIFKL